MNECSAKSSKIHRFRSLLLFRMVKMYPKAFVLLTLTTKSSIRIFDVEGVRIFISTKNHFKGHILSLVLVQNISFPLSPIALVLPATKELGYITI